MRRTLIRRVSKSAVFAQAAGFFSLLLLGLAIVLFRFERLDILAFLIVVVMAAGIAMLAMLFGAAGIWKLWNEGAKAGGASLRGMLFAAVTLTPVAFAAVQSVRLPPISDISTDLSNPPRFPVGARNPVALPFGAPATGPSAALMQAAAYPDLSSKLVELPVSEALAAVSRTAASLGWTPGPGAGGPASPDGLLRSYFDRTLLIGFTDDIVVRLLPVGDQVVIDVRSASRFGRSDLGANAARIRQFMTELDAQLLAVAR